MNSQWQDNLRNRMEQHEEPTPEGLWDGIERIMRAGSAINAIPSKRTIPLWVLRAGASAAVALILFFIGLHALKEDREETQVAEQSRYEQPVPSTPPVKIEPVTKIEGHLLAGTTGKRKTIAEKASYATETGTPVAMGETEKSPDENEQLPAGITDTTSDENQQRHPVNDNQQQPGVGTNTPPGFRLTAHGRDRGPSKWQTDVYASNMPSGTTSTHNGYGSFMPYELNPEEFALAAVERSDPPSDTRALKEYQHVYTDIKHSQPITLGISVKYNFYERWSLTSGLTYTILSSTLRSGTDNHYHHSQQTLHYVGVPLNLNYTVWENDKISTYVSGGGLVEKNVSGTLATDFVIDNKLETRNRQDIFVKPLQWSVNSAVGIQYQVAKNIGIYAEPGVAYYVKNKSEVETIYKEKPLNFNIRLGLRFSLNE